MAGRKRRPVCVEISEHVYHYFLKMVMNPSGFHKALSGERCFAETEALVLEATDAFGKVGERVLVSSLTVFEANQKHLRRIQREKAALVALKETMAADIYDRKLQALKAEFDEVLGRSTLWVVDPTPLNEWCLTFIPLNLWKRCLNAYAVSKKEQKYSAARVSKVSLRLHAQVAEALYLMCEEKNTTPNDFLTGYLKRAGYLMVGHLGELYIVPDGRDIDDYARAQKRQLSKKSFA